MHYVLNVRKKDSRTAGANVQICKNRNERRRLKKHNKLLENPRMRRTVACMSTCSSQVPEHTPHPKTLNSAKHRSLSGSQNESHPEYQPLARTLSDFVSFFYVAAMAQRHDVDIDPWSTSCAASNPGFEVKAERR